MTTATQTFHSQLSDSWAGRDDGPGPEHDIWYKVVQPLPEPGAADKGIALLGFASDEGIRRNHGRPGAAEGPESIRSMLGWLAVHDDTPRYDAGTVTVDGEDMEAAQGRLSEAVRDVVAAGHLPVVMGGGHETAFGSHVGLRRGLPEGHQPPGIVNLDAHLDLRQAEPTNNGTPFRQIAEAVGEEFDYSVIGVSRADNTDFLFQAARHFGATVVQDDELAGYSTGEVSGLARQWVSGREHIHLSIDLDVLNQAIAPGVTSPAAVGVDLSLIRAICVAIARTGRLALLDVVELSPPLDIDKRTARVASRLIHEISAAHFAAQNRAVRI